MICKVTFWFPAHLGFTSDMIKFYAHPYGIYEGHVKLLKVSNAMSGGFSIQGSLAKYFNRENVTHINREDVEKAIAMLERDSGISFENAIIRNVEFGTTFVMKEPPSRYLHLFGCPPRYTQNDRTNARNGLIGIDTHETATYDTRRGSIAFCAYDKVKEMGKKNIPEPFQKKHLLRMEYRLKRRPAIQLKFRRDLTAYDLFNPNVYRKLKELFFQFYFKIPKMGNTTLGTTSQKVTPAVGIKMFAELQRQNDPKAFFDFFHDLVDSGKMSQKDLDTINSIEWKVDKLFSLHPTNDLIIELNDLMNKVRDSADY
jgi:hypothetical protein